MKNGDDKKPWWHPESEPWPMGWADNSHIPTPGRFEQLQEWILDLPAKDRQLAMMVVGMTWNLAGKLFGNALESFRRPEAVFREGKIKKLD